MVLDTDRKDGRIPYFADPDIPEEEKQAARIKGGQRGGRKRKYIKHTNVEIDAFQSKDDVLKALHEVWENLREQDNSPNTARAMVYCLRTIGQVIDDKWQQEEIEDAIASLEDQLGVTK